MLRRCGAGHNMLSPDTNVVDATMWINAVRKQEHAADEQFVQRSDTRRRLSEQSGWPTYHVGDRYGYQPRYTLRVVAGYHQPSSSENTTQRRARRLLMV